MFSDELRAQILAVHRHRFVLVNNRWWVLEDGQWTQVSARERLLRAIRNMWTDLRGENDPWPRDYLVERLLKELASRFHCAGVPGRSREDDD